MAPPFRAVFSCRKQRSDTGRCFRAENGGRTPGRSPAPRKILKLDADPTNHSCRRPTSVSRAPAPEAAPPALQVIAGPADVYPRVKSLFTGMDVNFKTQQYVSVKREEEAAILPDVGNDLQFKIAVKAADNVDHSIHATGSITDYMGVELQKVTADISAKAGETAQQVFTIKPTEDHPGPFYLTGTWDEPNGKNKGAFSTSAGQPNWKLVVEDFELVRYPKPGGPLENTAAAKRRGEMGLTVRLQNPPMPVLLPGQRPPSKTPTPVTLLPLNIECRAGR